MGRPLKIAKAQAVITITNTTVTTNVVTTSANFTILGIIAGMPFIPASNIGGLTAGTVYYILEVLNAGPNSTFTASATPLNANPTFTSVPLSTAAGTVATTVAPVDNYFNNPVSGPGYPATNTATYGVVGGNTAIYGKQVLCNVAIGVAGTGTVFADTGSDMVTGLGTDFANVPTGVNMFALWGNDPNNPHLLGTTSASGSNVLVGLANTSATGNIIGVDIGSDATDLIEGGPVVFDVTAGGIVAGKTYFVLNVANSAAFTITATPNGPEVGLSTVSPVTGNAGQEQIQLTSNSANNASGVDGYGDPFVYTKAEDGYIVRQKGKQKYLVAGTTTGLVGQCYTANVANTALLPNTMTITATYANSATQKVQTLTDYHAGLFTASSSPDALANIVSPGQPTGTLGYINTAPVYTTFNSAVTTVAATALVAGTTYVIATLGNTDWAAVGAPGGYAVGTVFTATGAGTGTGTATIGGVPYPIVTIANA